MKRIATFLILITLGSASLCAMPLQINFQGTLKQQGVPVNTTENMQFSFVDGSGNQIPGTTVIPMANVQVTNGLFAVQLPVDPTINWQAYTPYIRVLVNGQTLSPDQPLNANLYAVAAIPPGVIVAFGGQTPPPGWLMCDGSSESRTTYSGLYQAIGTSWGSTDGSSFNLPDLRGRFLRGQDQGTGRDPDAANRVAMNVGGNSGDAVGSVEGVATQMPGNPFVTTVSGAHTHQYLRPFHGPGDQTGSNGTNWVISADQYGTTGDPEGTLDGAHSHAIIGGDHETRPVNASVNFIIKY